MLTTKLGEFFLKEVKKVGQKIINKITFTLFKKNNFSNKTFLV